PRHDRLAEATTPALARRGAPREWREPGRGLRPEPHPPLVPGLDVEELEAEAVLVVHVGDRPRAEPQRRPVALDARGAAARHGGVEPAPAPEAEGDVDDPLVADPVALGARARGGVGVARELDEHVAGPERAPLAAGPRQPPERLVRGAVDRRGRGEPEHPAQE